MGMVPTSMCICGHAKGYHDWRDMPSGGVVELCVVWACGCVEYETVADDELVEVNS